MKKKEELKLIYLIKINIIKILFKIKQNLNLNYMMIIFDNSEISKEVN